MHTRLAALLLLLSACAPAHQRAARGSALSPESQGAARAAVASTLSFEDPLEAPSCGLPTAPALACAAEPAPEAEDPHAHHHRTGGGER